MNRSKIVYQIIPKLIGLLFIVLFVYAAVSKLLDFGNFSLQLGKSPFISSYAPWLVWIIPFVELLIAVMFLFPKYEFTAFSTSFLLMSVFTLYIILVLNFSNDIPCSCGGVLQTLSWSEHLVFNIVFTALALSGIVITKQKKVHNKNSTT